MSGFLDRSIAFLLAVFLFVGPLLISPWGYDYAVLVKEAFLVLLSGTLFSLLFLRMAIERQWFTEPTPLGRPIALFLSCALLSLLRAVNVYAGLYRLSLILAGISLYYVTAHALLGGARIRRLATAATLSGLVATAYAVLQFLRLDPILPTSVGLSSTLGNANFLAEYLVAILPLALGLALSPTALRTQCLFGGAFVALFAGLLLSQAKGATLAFLASTALFALLVRTQGKGGFRTEFRRLIPFGFVALILVMVFTGAFLSQFADPGGIRGLIDRYVSSRAVYYKWRVVFYQDSLRMALANPLLGVGIGNFESVYPGYRSMPETLDPKHFILDHAHNDYLEIWSEVGLAGFAAFLWILAAFFRQILRSKDLSPLACALAASVGGLAVNSLFAFGLYNPMPLASFWLFMALALRATEAPQTVEPRGAVASALHPPLWAIGVAMTLNGVFSYLALRPLVADAYLSQGYALLASGRAEQAIPVLERAARLSPARLASQTYLNHAYSATLRHALAIMVLERYLRHDPYNFQVHYLLGLNHEERGDDSTALRAYERAREIYPSYSRPLLRMGMIQERRGESQPAMAAYREAVRLNPAFADASNRLAILLSNHGRIDEAIRVWEEAARWGPEDLTIVQNLAAAYRRTGDETRAADWEGRAQALRRKRAT